jgi:hypothetical protein
LHGEIFEFPKFFFCLKILFNVNGKATVGHTPCLIKLGSVSSQNVCPRARALPAVALGLGFKQCKN